VRSAIVIATILFLLSSCSRAPEHSAQKTPAQHPGSGHDGGFRGPYLVVADTLDRFIRYQDRVLALQGEMLAELSRLEQVDGGAAAVSVIHRQVEAEEGVRRNLALTERDVEELEAMVGDVISRRATLTIDNAREALREMEALASRLPAEQRAEFDATVAALRRQFEQSRELTEERKRYGAENVERILAREAELTAQWNRALAIFSGGEERKGPVAVERPARGSRKR
jgi:hypothetical protein